MTETVRVYVNANAVDIGAGSTAIDCVRAWKADEAEAVASGSRVITDSRGLPVPADTTIQAGSIFRTIPNRDATRASHRGD